MSAQTFKIAVLGDPRSAHFNQIVCVVREAVGERSFRPAADLRQLAETTVDSAWSPDVIIAVQTWPDEYSAADVNELIGRYAFARLLCCYGPWCDSDGRNRSIWPLAVRIPSATLPGRLKHELKLLADRPESGGRAAIRAERANQALPLTASRTEIFEFDCDQSPAPQLCHRTAGVVSPDRRWREMLGEALVRGGAALIDDVEIAGAEVVFLDVDPWDLRRATQLAAFRHEHPRTRLIACAGFPRPDLERELREAGADRIWFKLEPLATLAALMRAARP